MQNEHHPKKADSKKEKEVNGGNLFFRFDKTEKKADSQRVLPDLQAYIQFLEIETLKDFNRVYFLVNYTKNKFYFTSNNISELLGYEAQDFYQQGLPLGFDLSNLKDRHILHLYFKRANEFLKKYGEQGIISDVVCILNLELIMPDGTSKWIRKQKTMMEFRGETNSFEMVVMTQITEPLKQKTGFEFYLLNHKGRQTLEIYYPETKAQIALTKREIEILKLSALGLNSVEVADRLHISVHTVYQHRKRIITKMAVKNIGTAIHTARQAGLL